MAILVTRLTTAVSSRKTPKMAINAISRGCVHFQQMLVETKTKSKKFRIRWSKVCAFWSPGKSSYGHFSHPTVHGRFKPKNTQNGHKSISRGCSFSANVARDKIEERKFLHPMVKSTTRFGAPGNRDLLPFWVFFGLKRPFQPGD